jgi:pyrroloquinoline quinone (PQQ) biosynthesis protein C
MRRLPDAASPQRIPEVITPRLRHCTFFDRGLDNTLIVATGHRHLEITGKRLTSEQFACVCRYLDGQHTIAEVSAATGLPVAEISALVSLLQRLGATEDPQSDDLIPVKDFVNLAERTCATWVRQLNHHPLFTGLQEFSFRKEVFLGLIIETYHYVNSASRHIATAISHNQDSYLNELLGEYFVDEYRHATLILETLERLGLQRRLIKRSYPIGGTISLIQSLCEIARSSTIAYLLCTLFVEARAEELEPASASLRHICEVYGWPADALDALISHALGDVEAGHVSLLTTALDGVDVIPRGEADMAVNYLHDLKHAFAQQYDQVIKYYTNVSNHIPRLPVSLRSL